MTDLTLSQAQAALQAALDKSAELGLAMDVAVVDAGANLKAFARMDGAWLGSIDIATKKARTARWLAENPHPPGDIVERIMEDPFDYDNEDRLIAWWKAATAEPPALEWSTPPGYGLSYSGPGTSYERPDTRI